MRIVLVMYCSENYQLINKIYYYVILDQLFIVSNIVIVCCAFSSLQQMIILMGHGHGTGHEVGSSSLVLNWFNQSMDW
jgi:hypothetical protein